MHVTLTIFAMFLTSCTFFVGKRNSEWKELDTASPASCSAMPVQKDDIGINGVRTLKGRGKVALWTQVSKRNGEKRYYSTFFQGDKAVDAESLRQMALPKDALLLGGGIRGQEKIWAVVNRQGGAGEEEAAGGASLQLYRDGVGEAWGVAPLTGNVDEGQLLVGDESLWLKVRQDRQFRLAQIASPGGNKDLNLQWLPVAFRYEPTLLPGEAPNKVYGIFLADKNAPAIDSPQDLKAIEEEFQKYLATEGDEKSEARPRGLEGEVKGGDDAKEERDLQFEFRFQALELGKPVGKPLVLELPTQAGVEDWAVTGHGSGFKIAYIEGDSLAGRSQLHIAAFRLDQGQAVRQWTKSFSLDNLHVADPIWLPGPQEDRLVLLKWVDGERTLGAFKVSQQGAEAIGNVGVFPAGAAVVDAFSYGATAEVFAIIRTKASYLWQFDICQLSDL